ncbi:LysR family transcriptional regulator [Pantoea sp. EA-12]|uniref:LysR family transcriptional regulator n=1 Tax=Pantoea sp. EA-12 TaxID=3043303 RepID=UPI0024B5E35E|nr:LysR family transcriptional regulator [Pantoea sp. EA-12]MDI9222838.1 LysR family transcriptional regulator [Pantoea sp. EA-12]
MNALNYSFSQIEAFAAVAEFGTVSRAAEKLGKDRTTVRDLLDYLEDALGYTLFVREGRKLSLTPKGEQLHRQAHLLVRQAHAFEAFARTLPEPRTQQITLVYDPFVPRAFLHALVSECRAAQVRLSLWCASRAEAEKALKSGKADLAICQAVNRTLGNQLEWRALGSIALNFYAAKSLFADHAEPLTLLNLALEPQLVMHAHADEQITQRLQISGLSLFINERSMLQNMMEQGEGWGFLPTHFQAHTWRQVQVLNTEVGHQGLNITLVSLWAPGATKHAFLRHTLVNLQQVWDCAVNNADVLPKSN